MTLISSSNDNRSNMQSLFSHDGKAAFVDLTGTSGCTSPKEKADRSAS